MSMHYVECAVKSVGKLPDFSKKAENDPFEYFETAGAEEYKKAGKKEEVFEGALSTIESDRIGDVMLAKGCHFDDFIDNPVIQLMHSPFIPAIGKVLTIGVSDDQFKIWWIFDEGDDLGAKIKHKYSEKFMRSLSIGFRGKFVEVPEGAKSIEVNIPKLGKNHKVTIDFKGWKNKPRRVYNDWELHEGSACNIGMNARALVKTFASDLDETRQQELETALETKLNGLQTDVKAFYSWLSGDLSKKSIDIPNHTTTIEDIKWDETTAPGQLAIWASSDGSGEKNTIDFTKFAEGFAYLDGDSDIVGAYKYCHHTVVNGKLVTVWEGVKTAMVEALKDKNEEAYKHLVKHYPDVEFKIYTDEELEVIADKSLIGEDVVVTTELVDNGELSKDIAKAIADTLINFSSEFSEELKKKFLNVLDDLNLKMSIIRTELNEIKENLHTTKREAIEKEIKDSNVSDEDTDEINPEIFEAFQNAAKDLARVTSTDNNNEGGE